MRGGARAWLALLIAVCAVVGAVAAERLGPAVPAAAAPGSAVSSAWLCPHGGGPDWVGRVAIANPGVSDVQARIVSLGGERPKALATVDVAAGAEVIEVVPAIARGGATFVEVFGGWAAVGWVLKSDGEGTGSEPCTSAAGASWHVVDGATTKDVHSWLVVMNPFTSDAVVDVVLYLPDAPPVRATDWTDLRVRAGRSVALDLRGRALGEQIVGATVSATRGRVAVGSLTVPDAGGVRSVLASPSFSDRWVVPVAAGSGAGALSLLVPGDLGLRFGATQLSADSGPQPAGNLTVVRQGGTSTLVAPVATAGPSAIIAKTIDGAQIGIGLRELGRGVDDAATGGTATPSTAWVVLPAIVGAAPRATVVLVNDGDVAVQATVRLLPIEGTSPETTTITVPPGRTAAVPGTFLESQPNAAVLVTADGPLIALGAGVGGDQATDYAMGLGIPVPAGAFPSAP